MEHFLTTNRLYALCAVAVGSFSLYSFQIDNFVIGLGTAFATFVLTLFALGGGTNE